MKRRSGIRTTQRGFTLAEVLVAVSIFAVIFIAALVMYDRANNIFKRGVDETDVQQNTRVAFDKLVADVRMAGFDFDRDGVPISAADRIWAASTAMATGIVVVPTTSNGRTYRAVNGGTTGASQPTWPVTASGQVTDGTVTWQEQPGIFRFQQPDEQIEYIAKSAITIRGNYDFSIETTPCPPSNPNAGCGNGREPRFESTAFPVVTTGNDEIVTYALQSDDSTKNTDTISFYADVAKPRNVYPGGSSETQVSITGVDLTNNNPPYTLYRITLSDTGAAVRTPIASGIRSLTFDYFKDTLGQSAITTIGTATVDTTTTLGIGGAGQFDPTNPTAAAAADPRAVRASIKSVKVGLVGINSNIDPNYVDAVESSTSGPLLKNTRKYRLDSLVVPRNIGMSGIRELDVNPPGQPIVSQACVGYCGIAKISWLPPAVNSDQGSADDYDILYDTNSSGSFASVVNIGGGTTGFVYNLDPAKTYYFKVRARNSFGAATSANVIAASVKNKTTPSAPLSLTATGGTDATKPAQNNKVVVTWAVPVANVSGNDQVTCLPPPGPTGGTNQAADVLPQEIQGYRVYRSTDSTFATSTLIVDENTRGALIPVTLNGTVTFTDTTAANCIDYYYKVRAVEYCNARADYNVGSAVGLSALSNAVQGKATSTATPIAPSDLTMMNASCTGVGVGNTCTLTWNWPRVILDNGTPAQTISVDTYILKRVRKTLAGVASPEAAPAGWVLCNTIVGLSAEPGVCKVMTGYADPTGTALASTTDSNVSTSFMYDYQVAAQQCNNTGPWSPTRTYPCALGGGVGYTLSLALSGAYDGTGSAAAPWIVQTPDNSTLTVTLVPTTPNPPTPISSFSAAMYVGPTLFAVLNPIGPPGSPLLTRQFDVPSGTGDGTTYTFVVTAIDTGTPNGCTNTAIGYMEDAPSGCCVVPLSNDATIVSYVPGNSFVDVTFKNLCSPLLNIQATGGVTIAWTPTLAPASTTLTTVDFPANGANGTVAVSVNNSTGAATSLNVPATAVTTIPAQPPLTWNPLTAYTVGSLVVPNPANGRQYVCVTAGTSGASQPAFPTTDYDIVSDGTAVWKELTKYTIRINFSKPIVGATSPVASVCVTYRRAVDVSNQNCKIVPAPSATANSCN